MQKCWIAALLLLGLVAPAEACDLLQVTDSYALPAVPMILGECQILTYTMRTSDPPH